MISLFGLIKMYKTPENKGYVAIAKLRCKLFIYFFTSRTFFVMFGFFGYIGLRIFYYYLYVAFGNRIFVTDKICCIYDNCTCWFAFYRYVLDCIQVLTIIL